MQAFNFTCVSCSSQLLETGLLLTTAQGPFVCCDVCRALYFIQVLENYEGKAVVVVEPARLDPEFEFDLIRQAQCRVPLKEYLLKQENDYLTKQEKKFINPHFDKDLKTIINEAVTPSDIIRGLNGK